MADQRHTVLIDLRIVEFTDGHQINECKLRQEGDVDYLAVAKRCLEAIHPLGAGSMEPVDPGPIELR